ncbi:MAG: hypothetical protein K9I95_00225 [Flavobacteriaceae bacterium]|jgi:hypothetical protein|nr:hypothetical protein [Flavobacteriaceae bacterium]
MGGEGAMMAMINSLKNNKSLLSKRKDKNALTGSYSNIKLAKLPNTTPEELIRIKEKIQKDNKRIMIKQIIVVSILFCFILFFILYVFQ